MPKPKRLVMHANGCVVDVTDPLTPQIVVRLVYADAAMARALFDAACEEMRRRGDEVEALPSRTG